MLNEVSDEIIQYTREVKDNEKQVDDYDLLAAALYSLPIKKHFDIFDNYHKGELRMLRTILMQ